MLVCSLDVYRWLQSISEFDKKHLRNFYDFVDRTVLLDGLFDTRLYIIHRT